MNINYYRKNVYGVEKIYIEDKTQAACVSMLTGKMTVDQRDIDAIKELSGATFTEVIAPRV